MVNTRSQRAATHHRSASGSTGIIIVAYGNEVAFPELLRQVAKQKRPSDYVVVIDNHPEHGCAALAEQSPAVDHVIRSDNVGFAAGCNRAVAALPADIELILLLNPDVLPAANAIATLRDGAAAEWSAWMGLLTLPDGTINSAGNVVHMSGLSWCNDYARPASSIVENRSVQLVSGACLMIRKAVWDELGGLAEDYFMYYEDTDLSVRLWQRGLTLGLVAEARFEHDYEFERGASKWFYLERNRYIFMIRLWPARLLIALAPFLIGVEIGLWVLSLGQGRFGARCRALTSFARLLPRLLIERRQLLRQSSFSSRQFLDHLQVELNSPLLGTLGRSRILNGLLQAYYRFARLLV